MFVKPDPAWLILIAICAAWAAWTLAAAFTARMKNRDPLTFGLLGLLFGWIGLLIAIVTPAIRLENLACSCLDDSEEKPEVVRGRLVPYRGRLVFTSDKKNESFEIFYSEIIGSRIILKRERKREGIPARMFGIANLQVLEVAYGLQGRQEKARFSVYETAIGALQRHVTEMGTPYGRLRLQADAAPIAPDAGVSTDTLHLTKPSMVGAYMLLVVLVLLAVVPFALTYSSRSRRPETETGNWTDPQQVSTRASESGQNPQIAVDRDGNPKVVWCENAGSSDRVCYGEKTESGWIRQALSSRTSDAASPGIALDEEGNPNVVWEAYDGSATRIYYSKKTESTWTTEEVSIRDSLYSACPEIALDERGYPNVVWEGYDGITYQIYYAKKTASGWVAELVSKGASADNRDPLIALGPDGSPSVAWEGYDDSACHVFYAKRTGGRWSPREVSGDTSTGNRNPHLAAGPDGTPNLVWEVREGWNSQVQYAKRTGGRWSRQRVPTGSPDAGGVQLALDKDGNPNIVWCLHDEDDGELTVYYARKTEYGWARERVSGDSSLNNIEPQIALDGEGNPNVVWLGLGRDDWSYGVFYANRTPGGWSSRRLSAHRNSDAWPQVAVDGAGCPQVVWSESGGDISEPPAYLVYWCGQTR